MKKKKSKDKKVYLIAAGHISGTYAERFHRVTEDGKTGHFLDQDPIPEDVDLILDDIVKHRSVLLQELNDLLCAEIILRKIK